MLDSKEECLDETALTSADRDGDKQPDKTLQHQKSVHANYLIYGVKDSPPIHITIVCALQVTYHIL
jgi:hypothetical protein